MAVDPELDAWFDPDVPDEALPFEKVQPGECDHPTCGLICDVLLDPRVTSLVSDYHVARTATYTSSVANQRRYAPGAALKGLLHLGLTIPEVAKLCRISIGQAVEHLTHGDVSPALVVEAERLLREGKTDAAVAKATGLGERGVSKFRQYTLGLERSHLVYTPDQINQVVSMWFGGHGRDEIVAATGVKYDRVCQVIRKAAA